MKIWWHDVDKNDARYAMTGFLSYIALSQKNFLTTLKSSKITLNFLWLKDQVIAYFEFKESIQARTFDKEIGYHITVKR